VAKKYDEDPFCGMSVAQRRLVALMYRDGRINTRQAVEACYSIPYEEMSDEKKRDRRHSIKRAMRGLADRGLVVIDKRPNVRLRKLRNDSHTFGSWGEISSYSLTREAVRLIQEMKREL
jgi:hypothetical protein